MQSNPCKNFSPNIFNKNKCQNCFKPRETHLLSDKDLSKAKPIYGGWLLLAPIGTDFNNPTQKNRKWQRRWFLLFEHGALRYSLDNNETTLAQGTIDMNRSTDVLYAESITDQKYSLCIYIPEQNYYVRGECKEDIMGWHDQLVVYPQTMKEEMRLKKRLFKKRKSEAPAKAQTGDDVTKPPLGSPLLLRSRNNSSSSSIKSPISERGGLAQSWSYAKRNDPADLILPPDKPTGPYADVSGSKDIARSGSKSSIRRSDVHTETNSNQHASKLDPSYFTVDRKHSSEPTPRDKTDSGLLVAGSLQRHTSISTSSLDSTTSSHSLTESTDGSQAGNTKKKHFKDHQNLSDAPKAKRMSNRHFKDQHKEVEKKSRARSPGRDDANLGKERRRSRVIETSQADPSNKENNEPSLSPSDGSHGDQSESSIVGVTSPVVSPLGTPRGSDREEKRGRTITRRQTNMKQGTQTDSPRSGHSALRRAKSLDRSSYNAIHLDPDLFSMKEGWLQMQEEGGQWKKHRFALTKNELKYFNGSSLEDPASPVAVISLDGFINVYEWEVQRHYGFQVKTKENTFTFAAMTPGSRQSWIKEIKKAGQSDQINEDASKEESRKEDKPRVEEPQIELPSKTRDLEELSAAERAQRRKARIRDRRRDGRSRTIDTAQLRADVTQALGYDPVANPKPDVSSKQEGKARSRTLHPDSLLKQFTIPYNDNDSTEVVDGKDSDKSKISVLKPLIRRSSSELQVSIEDEWKKVEKVNQSRINGENPLSPSPISKTALMVKALQSEVDSLKKQMERVEIEKTSSNEEAPLPSSQTENAAVSDDGSMSKLQSRIDQQSGQLDKLKQELALSQEALRKQSSLLRESGMQLDITLSESQVIETQLINSQNELRLEKSRREEAEKEHTRKVMALHNELERSESQLKKSETMHLEAQRKIRELERQIHISKDHNEEESLLQNHIVLLRRHAEEQEVEMREMQGAFEDRCQKQKKLEDHLSDAQQIIENYKAQVHDMKEALKITNKDLTIASSRRKDAQLEVEKLSAELKSSKMNEDSLKEKIERLIAQSEVDEDCNKSLQDNLAKEKETNRRLQSILKEHQDTSVNEAQLAQMSVALDQLTSRLKASEDSTSSLQNKQKELTSENSRLKDEISKCHQVEKDLRARLNVAEKELGDIDEIRSRSSSSTESSFKAKLTELEAEMGGTRQMIAARLQSLEPSRRGSDSSIVVEKESTSQKISRLEMEISKKNEDLKVYGNKLKEMEDRESDAESQFAAKLKELKGIQDDKTRESEKVIEELKLVSSETNEKLQSTQECLQQLHSRVFQIKETENMGKAATLLESVLHDTLRLSKGEADFEATSLRSPSPTSKLGDKKWSRVSDAESRQQHLRTMSRLRQLTEQLKSADGRLVSPSASPVSFVGQPGLPLPNSKVGATAQPAATPSLALNEATSAQLFAKQISTQALLLAEMATALRRNQSPPSLVSPGRNQSNFNHNNRQNTPSPQLSSAEFSDTIAHHAMPGGLLQHVDTLAQKLTLEGMLMREINLLKDSWMTNRGSRALSHRPPGLQSGSDLSCAMVAHAHISYVLQVYNERISRLSLEARQARHRADAAMRKLRELVQACKTQDLEAVSNLAVQVDTDSIATPYSDVPPWEQQVDYGTLHGAQSMSSPPPTDSAYLEQEANFFQHLAEDLKCMSVDVQSLTKLGVQLVQTDAALQKYLEPDKIGEHASAVAREAIVQAEIIYISHRLRRDYDEELRKAKNAVTEQSKHFEAFKNKAKQTEESWAGKIKQKNEDHNAKVNRLMQEVGRLENEGADISKDVEERLTRLSRKHEEELASCNAKHEQETLSLKKNLANVKSQLENSAKDYMREVEGLKSRLEQIQKHHRKEIEEARGEYDRKYEVAKKECSSDIAKLKKSHEDEVKTLKRDFEKELTEVEKEFSDKLTAIEAAKKDEIESMKKKHRNSVKSTEKDHQDALGVVQQETKSKLLALKQEFDDLMKQEKSKHQMELKHARSDAEAGMQETLLQKTNALKKEHEQLLENQNKLHKEQLEREKEIWSQEVRQKLESEREVSHSRSSSLMSESESKDALKAQISSLEEKLNSMQGKLEDEQHRHSYQYQLDEVKSLCDQSFAAIEESHSKQLEDILTAHKREIEKLSEEHSAELKANEEDTRRVVEVMRKHHLEELQALSEQPVQTGSNQNDLLRADVEKLKKEIETLSEHYSRKCVELANAVERSEKAEDSLRSLENDNRLLQASKEAIADQKIESEVKKMKNNLSNDDQNAGDLYQLQVLLRVKTSEMDYLKQEVSSLKKQIEDIYQEKKKIQRKHQSLFDELTLSRSKEGLARREATRLKEKLRRCGIQSDDDLDADTDESHGNNTSGYDFQKSRSQPDFSNNLHKPSSTSTSPPKTSSNVSVKRRSSDRSSRYGKV